MYENRARHDPTQQQVDRHDGTYQSLLRHHQLACSRAVRRGPTAVREILPLLPARIADPRNLRCAWDHLASHGGDAPGPDGDSYRDYTNREVWGRLRALSADIRGGTYTVGPGRRVAVPKRSGEGTRTLTIQNVVDRIVQRGTQQILQPLVDPTFARLSFGGRPFLGVLDALAHAEALAKRDGRHTWVAIDIQNAFDNVPLNRLLDVVAKRLPNACLVSFIEQQIQNRHGRGLRQGSPLSPLLLNIYLDHLVDRPWMKHCPGTPLLRYADDLLLLCFPQDDVDRLYDALAQRLISAGLPPKGTQAESIRDLTADETVRWLGFDIRHRSLGLEFRLPTEGGNQLWLLHLRDSLALAHEKTHSPLRALQAVDGLIDAAGPTFPFTDQKRFYRQVCHAMKAFDFEDLLSRKEFLRRSKRAYQCWCARRLSISRSHMP